MRSSARKVVPINATESSSYFDTFSGYHSIMRSRSSRFFIVLLHLVGVTTHLPGGGTESSQLPAHQSAAAVRNAPEVQHQFHRQVSPDPTSPESRVTSTTDPLLLFWIEVCSSFLLVSRAFLALTLMAQFIYRFSYIACCRMKAPAYVLAMMDVSLIAVIPHSGHCCKNRHGHWTHALFNNTISLPFNMWTGTCIYHSIPRQIIYTYNRILPFLNRRLLPNVLFLILLLLVSLLVPHIRRGNGVSILRVGL